MNVRKLSWLVVLGGLLASAQLAHADPTLADWPVPNGGGLQEGVKARPDPADPTKYQLDPSAPQTNLLNPGEGKDVTALSTFSSPQGNPNQQVEVFETYGYLEFPIDNVPQYENSPEGRKQFRSHCKSQLKR